MPLLLMVGPLTVLRVFELLSFLTITSWNYPPAVE